MPPRTQARPTLGPSWKERSHLWAPSTNVHKRPPHHTKLRGQRLKCSAIHRATEESVVPTRTAKGPKGTMKKIELKCKQLHLRAPAFQFRLFTVNLYILKLLRQDWRVQDVQGDEWHGILKLELDQLDPQATGQEVIERLMFIVSLHFCRDWYVPRAQLAKKSLTLGSKYTADVSKMFEEFLVDVPTTWRTSYLAIPSRLIDPFFVGSFNEMKESLQEDAEFYKGNSQRLAQMLAAQPSSVSQLSQYTGATRLMTPQEHFRKLSRLVIPASEQLLGPTAFEPDQEVQVEDLENHLLLSLTTGSTDYTGNIGPPLKSKDIHIQIVDTPYKGSNLSPLPSRLT